MSTSETDEQVIETTPMVVTITGESPDGFTYTTEPETVEFHSKKKRVALDCTIGPGPVSGNFVFSGYNYPVAGVEVDARNAGTSAMKLTFQFNGQKTGGSLLFNIIDDTGRALVVDPQVGNDPEPGL